LLTINFRAKKKIFSLNKLNLFKKFKKIKQLFKVNTNSSDMSDNNNNNNNAKEASVKKAASSKAAKASSGKAADPKSRQHPKFIDMILEGIKKLNERTGSSRQALLKYVLATYAGMDAKHASVHIKLALVRGVKTGLLKRVKGVGASGSFRLAAAVTTPRGKAATNAAAGTSTSAVKRVKNLKKASKAKAAESATTTTTDAAKTSSGVGKKSSSSVKKGGQKGKGGAAKKSAVNKGVRVAKARRVVVAVTKAKPKALPKKSAQQVRAKLAAVSVGRPKSASVRANVRRGLTTTTAKKA
jgi:histone H1/5